MAKSEIILGVQDTEFSSELCIEIERARGRRSGKGMLYNQDGWPIQADELHEHELQK